MKSETRLSFRCSFTLAFLVSAFSAAETLKAEVWTYPIRPGVPAWKGIEDQFSATQIPSEVVTAMSTKDLADSCLAFPLLSDLYSASTIEDGFNYILSHFNALQVLLKRPDVGEI